MRIARNPAPGEIFENGDRKTLINRGLQNPKHGKRASQVRDGYLTVRDSEVLISLGFKITEMHFLKAQKKGKIHP
jgi:hypothetical protein